MAKGILIIGNESRTLEAVLASSTARVGSVVKAVAAQNPSSGRKGSSPRTEQNTDATLIWNPASAVSARTVIVGAENRLGKIDEAILVCAPPPIRVRADELVPADIDYLADSLIKGWFFMVRELASFFRAKKEGTLIFVLDESELAGIKGEAPDLFGSSAAESFRSLAHGLLQAGLREQYRVLAFSCSETDDHAGFADFISKTLEEPVKQNKARWNKYGKGGLFSFL